MRTTLDRARRTVTLAIFLLPAVTQAGAPGGPLVSFAEGILTFLTAVLGPVIFGIGLAVAAISLAVGSREGMHKAIYAIAGGALLFSVGSITTFVRGVAH